MTTTRPQSIEIGSQYSEAEWEFGIYKFWIARTQFGYFTQADCSVNGDESKRQTLYIDDGKPPVQTLSGAIKRLEKSMVFIKSRMK